MSEPFVGEIKLFAANFAPRGYALCNGQVLPIPQNQALFALLGTTYGGNGTTTFALPNLQGRLPIHQGQGPGLTQRTMGENAGMEAVTLITTQMPSHTHGWEANSGAAQGTAANNATLAVAVQNSYQTNTSTNLVNMANMVGIAGGSQPHTNVQPFLCINFMIALQGVFPSRN